MKKLIIILTFLISSIFSYSQGVKISAMPQWTSSLDSVWFPIINFSDPTWVNYRAQGWQLGKERIDSIINNWPVSGGGIQSVEGQNGTVVVNDSIVKLGTNPLIENTVLNGQATYYLRITDSRFEQDLGVSIAAANDLTLGNDGNSFIITGATQINAITTANWQAGSIVYLIFASTPTVKHNTAGGAGTAPILLSGAVDFVAAANDVLTLVYDGTSWHETSRKLAAVAAGARFGIEDNTGVQNRTWTAAANTFDWTFNSITGNGFNISSTSTAIANNSKTVSIIVSGALSTSTVSNYGLYVQNTRTGTSISNYAIYGDVLIGEAVHGNTTTGTGVKGQSGSSGAGVIGQSSSGLGVWGISSSNTGVSANSTTAQAFIGAVTGTATTNAVVKQSEFQISSSGTVAANFGGYFNFVSETSTNNSTNAVAQLEWFWTDPAVGTSTGSFAISTTNSTSMTRKLEVTGGGNVKILTAGKGLALTSPDGTVYYGTISNAGVLSWSTTAP